MQCFRSCHTKVLKLLSRYRLHCIAVVCWVLLLGIFQYFRVQHGFSVIDTLLHSVEFIATTPWGPLLYLFVYLVRPLLFLPATPLTIFAGAVFGVGQGLLYALIAANASAHLAYWIGRFFGYQPSRADSILGEWIARLQTHPFRAVLFMRLFYVPFDLANYGAGIFRIRWPAYAFATVIGITPGVATFVIFGASINTAMVHAQEGRVELFELEYLALSALIFAGSLGVSQFVRRMYTKKD